MILLRVLACPNSLALLPIVDQSALAIRNAHQLWRVFVKNVVTHALEHVARMLNVASSVIHQFAFVFKATKVTRSRIVVFASKNRRVKIFNHVYPTLVDRMLIVVNKMEQALANVYQNTLETHMKDAAPNVF